MLLGMNQVIKKVAFWGSGSGKSNNNRNRSSGVHDKTMEMIGITNVMTIDMNTEVSSNMSRKETKEVIAIEATNSQAIHTIKEALTTKVTTKTSLTNTKSIIRTSNTMCRVGKQTKLTIHTKCTISNRLTDM